MIRSHPKHEIRRCDDSRRESTSRKVRSVAAERFEYQGGTFVNRMAYYSACTCT